MTAAGRAGAPTHFVILSDIHANMEALEAVWAHMDRTTRPQGRVVVCLGDMIGYGADPEAVVHFLRGKGVLAVQGNHEFGVLRPRARRMFNPVSREALEWTAARLSPQTLDWMASLPLCLSLEGCRFVHGFPPKNPSRYVSEVSREGVAQALRNMAETVCFVGHTHLLGKFSLEGDKLVNAKLRSGQVLLEPSARHLVNAGAVGQPRDGDLDAKYLVYTPGSRRLDIVCVPYDAAGAARKIIAAGLPRVYADRLLPD